MESTVTDDGYPIFCDQDFEAVFNMRQGEITKQIGHWEVTLYADSPELWLSRNGLPYSKFTTDISIYYHHWANRAGFFINHRGSTREKVVDFVASSHDIELQNFFLFNQLL